MTMETVQVGGEMGSMMGRSNREERLLGGREGRSGGREGGRVRGRGRREKKGRGRNR